MISKIYKLVIITRMEDLFNNIKAQLTIAEQEYASLKSGRKSSAPRLRKSLMALKNDSHKLRASTTQMVKGLPTKSRKAVVQVPPTESEVKVEVPAVEVEPKKKRVKAKKIVASSPEVSEVSA